MVISLGSGQVCVTQSRDHSTAFQSPCHPDDSEVCNGINLGLRGTPCRWLLLWLPGRLAHGLSRSVCGLPGPERAP